MENQIKLGSSKMRKIMWLQDRKINFTVWGNVAHIKGLSELQFSELNAEMKSFFKVVRKNSLEQANNPYSFE